MSFDATFTTFGSTFLSFDATFITFGVRCFAIVNVVAPPGIIFKAGITTGDVALTILTAVFTIFGVVFFMKDKLLFKKPPFFFFCLFSLLFFISKFGAGAVLITIGAGFRTGAGASFGEGAGAGFRTGAGASFGEGAGAGFGAGAGTGFGAGAGELL